MFLDPIERVWLYLKERYLSQRLHADYDSIVDAACAAWNKLKQETGRITSLCTYSWLKNCLIAVKILLGWYESGSEAIIPSASIPIVPIPT